MKRQYIIGTIIILGIVSTALAGQMWSISCPHCDYSGGFISGGIMVRGMISGACGTCRRIVTISWDWKKDKAPEPSETLWDAASGRTFKVFKCPDCKGPFIQIEDAKTDLRFCPRCHKPGLKVEKDAIVD